MSGATISRRDLLRAATVVAMATGAKWKVPILQAVRIAVADGVARLECTDLDIRIRQSLDAEGELLATCVPTRRLLAILKNTTGDLVTLTNSPVGGTLEITNEDRSQVARVTTWNLLDWPDLPRYDAEPAFSIATPEGALAGLLKPVVSSCSTEETRYYLNGAYLHMKDGAFRAVSTDGHRLRSIEMMPAKGTTTGEFVGAIVATPVVKILLKLADKDEVVLSFGHGEKRGNGRAVFGRTVVDFTTIDGTFPDYNRVVPKEFARRITVDSAIMARALRFILSNSEERWRNTKLTATADTLKLESKSPEDGTTSAVIAATKTGFTPAAQAESSFEIGFNPRYVLEMLAAFGPGPINFDVMGQGDPALITGKHGEGFGVLMPMRV